MKLVIFDLDGTLVDSAAVMVESAVAACDAAGIAAPAPEVIRSVSGLTLEVGLKRLAPDADDAAIALFADHYRQAYQTRVAEGLREPLFEGIREAVEQLHARDDMLLAVATGKAFRGASRVLELHGLRHLFGSIQTPDANPSKPHPGMIHAAMSVAGVDKADTAMVGDTSHDMEMARAAGVAAIGVGWGYHSPETLADAGADTVLQNYADLVGTIDRIWETVRYA